MVLCHWSYVRELRGPQKPQRGAVSALWGGKWKKSPDSSREELKEKWTPTPITQVSYLLVHKTFGTGGWGWDCVWHTMRWDEEAAQAATQEAVRYYSLLGDWAPARWHIWGQELCCNLPENAWDGLQGQLRQGLVVSTLCFMWQVWASQSPGLSPCELGSWIAQDNVVTIGGNLELNPNLICLSK